MTPQTRPPYSDCSSNLRELSCGEYSNITTWNSCNGGTKSLETVLRNLTEENGNGFQGPVPTRLEYDQHLCGCNGTSDKVA